MLQAINRKTIRTKKHLRVRNKIHGTLERPRLSVYRSLNHIYAQIINDQTGLTLVAASTLDPALKDKLTRAGNTDAARMVGALVAEKALAKGISRVVFDRGGYVYHGRIAALTEGARKAGLEF